MKVLGLGQAESFGQKFHLEIKRLQWDGHLVSEGPEFIQALRQFNPDLIYLEANVLADFGALKEVPFPIQAPIIAFCDNMTEEFLVQGFDLGVDAFWPHSHFSSRILEARSKSLLRLQGRGPRSRFIPHLELLVDSEQYTITIRNQLVNLTVTEFRIVRELACHQVPVVSRSEIEARVFGNGQLRKRSLDVHICSIRKKINPVHLEIESIRGVGYRLSPCRVDAKVLISKDGTT